MSDPARPRSVRSSLADALIFAPIGFWLDANRATSDLAAAGRKQVTFSRSLGKVALRTIESAVRSANPPDSDGEPPDSDAATDSDRDVDPGPGVSAAALYAVAGYGDLTARQVVELVRDAPIDTVRWVHAVERSAKKRVTILRAAAKRLGE